jgi:hypothetical protein
LHHPLDAVAAQPAVVADTFDFQQAPIDLAADLAQIGQIAQALVDAKILRFAEGPLRSAPPPFFEILALSENSMKGSFYAAFWKATNSVLVAARRCAFSSRYRRFL